ncbi:hypothetical protein FJY71_09775, partial [candidate division WOR-3 bacterium]|nr:hypothetical protein [candidate division WOR-3 bacterium]
HEVGLLEFHRPDHGRFPCLGLAYRALRSGPSAPCVLNAANQVAVEAFLAGRIAFGTIPRIIKSTLGTLARGASGRRAGLWRLRRAAADAAALAQRLVLRLGSGRQPER